MSSYQSMPAASIRDHASSYCESYCSLHLQPTSLRDTLDLTSPWIAPSLEAARRWTPSPTFDSDWRTGSRPDRPTQLADVPTLRVRGPNRSIADGHRARLALSRRPGHQREVPTPKR